MKRYEVWLIDETAPRELLHPENTFPSIEQAYERVVHYRQTQPKTTCSIVGANGKTIMYFKGTP